MVGHPGAAPGASWPQTRRVLLALSCPINWTCTPGSHRVGRFCKPLARLFALCTMIEKEFPQSVLPRRRLRHREECCWLHYEGILIRFLFVPPGPGWSMRRHGTPAHAPPFPTMDPPVRFALTWTGLRNRRLSQSATGARNGTNQEDVCGMPVPPQHALCGMPAQQRHSGWVRSTGCYIHAAN